MKLTPALAGACIALVVTGAACSSPRPTSSATVVVPEAFQTESPSTIAMVDAATTKETRVFDVQADIDSDVACNWGSPHETE